jgi:hypothetical protein
VRVEDFERLESHQVVVVGDESDCDPELGSEVELGTFGQGNQVVAVSHVALL